MVDLGHTPASSPPPGLEANFENPESIANRITEISIPFSCVATSFVLARLYGRLFVVRSFGLDDACIVIGLLFSWAFCILGIANIPYGYGNHLWDLYVPDVVTFLQIDLGGQSAYFIGTCFVKVSIVLLYLRLNPERIFRYLAWLIIAFDVAYSLISVLVVTLGCTPVSGSWDITIPSTCVDRKAYYYAQAVFNIISDCCTLVLPIRLCWRLQMHLRQRIMLGLLFALGSLACIVSIIRLVTMIPTLKDNDFTWYKVQVAAWCEVEINIGIVCGCLPCMKPIISHHFPRLLGSTPSTRVSGESSKPNPGYKLNPFSKERRDKEPKSGSWEDLGANIANRANDSSESVRSMLGDLGKIELVSTTEWRVDFGSCDDFV